MEYALKKETSLSYEEALQKLPELLKEQGFGVLTEIDVKETLKKKLDVDYDKYKILGACNPKFAYKALSNEPEVGVLLPCNVVVHEKDGKTMILAFNPINIGQMSDNPTLKELGTEVKSAFEQIFAKIPG